eukprot:gb/GECH01012622.1/.p1 GENE.gb/GECH01012622.1/~~gb/GECH01012622.1/.p1  ORF type:complete len:168 (+),score=75.82 gb/GECH01012622.1/:1-504(+)
MFGFFTSSSEDELKESENNLLKHFVQETELENIQVETKNGHINTYISKVSNNETNENNTIDSSSSSSPSSSSSSSLDNNRINERNNLNNNNNRDLKTRLNQMQEFIKGLGSQIERQQGIPTRDKTELNKIWETLGGWLVNDSVRQEPTIVSQIENLLETTDALKALC